MQLWVTQRVENGQEDQARRTDERKHDRQAGEDLLTGGRVRYEAPAVPQPAVGAEGDVQEDGRHHAAGDEQRLEL